MTLIIILLAIAIEHYAGVAEELRNFTWFPGYVHALENRLAGNSLWNSPAGVIITLAGPLLLVAVLLWIMSKLTYPLELVLALVLLLYALGPGYLHRQLNLYIKALKQGDLVHIQKFTAEFSAETGDAASDDRRILGGILVQANHRLFGVLFWFILLGPFGALLYRLSTLLMHEQRDIHGNFADSVRDLYNILNWPASRLLALGNALTGNMVDALEAWREVEKSSLLVNDDLIRASGLGALSYQEPEAEGELLIEERIYWLHAVQGLLNRTLLVWLTILGLMTLSGWMY
jgi:Membrane protein required for beta-lactamase induction